MTPTDAGAPAGGVSGAQVLAQLGGASPRFSIGQGKPPRPAVVREPEPEPVAPPVDDPRSLAELEAGEAAARAVVNGLLERQLGAAERLEALDRQIAGQSATLQPGASLEARRERAGMAVELAELDAMVARANAAHDATSGALNAARTRQAAERLREELATIEAEAAASDAAIEAAIVALLDLEDARHELIEKAKRTRADLESVPPALRGYVPTLNSVHVDTARLLRFRMPSRRRLWLFGL